jgi:hypothetical protein
MVDTNGPLKGWSHEILLSFFLFQSIDMKLVIGPDQVYFSFYGRFHI